MLYIRADGNREIGMGHVMRCLAVAEAVADIKSAYPPVFITADEECRKMIEDRGFHVIVLNTDYRDMIGELSLMEGVLQARQDTAGTVLLVDSYQAGREYYLGLRKLVKVACFEDMGQTYPVDLLINYNIYAPGLERHYKKQETESGAKDRDQYPQKVLLGAEYMPLRKAFQECAEYVIHNKVTNVIITTGGSDPCFAAGVLTEALRSDPAIVEQGIHLHLISGPFNRFAAELRARYQEDAKQEKHSDRMKISIHENVKDMRSLFLESDVVITATGSTIYEISSLGVPMIVFYFAENQRQGAETLERLTDIVNAGCFSENPGVVAARVKEALKRCAADRTYRELLHRQERQLIDGKGARRIAERLAELAAGAGSDRATATETG